MPRNYPPQSCANPECDVTFSPRRRNHIYCIPQCQSNFNNDKKREKERSDYKLEKEIRKNEKILIKVFDSPCYKNEEIEIRFLEHEGFDFKISTDTEENQKTGKLIRWCHRYGIELKNAGPKTFTIHKRNKI